MPDKKEIRTMPFKDSPSIHEEVSQIFWEADRLRGFKKPPSLDDIERRLAPKRSGPPSLFR